MSGGDPLISVVQFNLDIGSIVSNGLSQLIQDLLNIFETFFMGLVNIILGAIDSALAGILGLFGIPFHAWAVDVSGQGLIIPILFVGILGLAGAIAYFFFIIYGFEGDIRGGEEDVGRLEENIEEEE